MDKNTSLDLTNITYELARNSVEKTTENVQDSSTVVINLIINIMACPFTILLNVMVIMAVKRRTRLQTNSNILLACLAATDAFSSIVAKTWYSDVTSQEDDKKVIKSGGHRPRFDVTMLTNTAI